MSERLAAATPLEFEVFTLFPAAIEAFVTAGLLGKAQLSGLVRVHCTDFRAFTSDRHRTVDDTPFGGGPGMVMRIEPVVAALEHVVATRGAMHRVLLSPSGRRFDQATARRLAGCSRIALLCGRYEGIDDRVREQFVDEVLSIGDFVLNGGEVAALAVIEAVARLREGVLGNPESALHESFADDRDGPWLEHPQYTRPASFRGHEVPSVLLSGDHAAIAAWRRAQSRARTWSLRPDLRPAPQVPADAPLYVALTAAMGSSPEAVEPLVQLLRTHHVAGLVAVGAHAAADALALAAATGGRPHPAAFPELRALRRRLRRSHGCEPFVIGVAGRPLPRRLGSGEAAAMPADADASAASSGRSPQPQLGAATPELVGVDAWLPPLPAGAAALDAALAGYPRPPTAGIGGPARAGEHPAGERPPGDGGRAAPLVLLLIPPEVDRGPPTHVATSPASGPEGAPRADSAGARPGPEPAEGRAPASPAPSGGADGDGIRRAALASDPELIDPSQPRGWGAALASDLDPLLRALAARRGE